MALDYGNPLAANSILYYRGNDGNDLNDGGGAATADHDATVVDVSLSGSAGVFNGSSSVMHSLSAMSDIEDVAAPPQYTVHFKFRTPDIDAGGLSEQVLFGAWSPATNGSFIRARLTGAGELEFAVAKAAQNLKITSPPLADNTWYECAVVVDGAGTPGVNGGIGYRAMYIDYTDDQNDADVIANVSIDGTNELTPNYPFTIGALASGTDEFSTHFTGEIEFVHLIKAAHTPTQIAAYTNAYNADPNFLITATPVATINGGNPLQPGVAFDVVIDNTSAAPTTGNTTLLLNNGVEDGVAVAASAVSGSGPYTATFTLPEGYGPASTNFKYAAALSAFVTVDAQTIGRTVDWIPENGNGFVDLQGYAAGAADIVGTPTLVDDDQLEFELSSKTVTGFDININAAGQISVNGSGDPEGAQFDVRVWRAATQTWSPWATYTIDDVPQFTAPPAVSSIGETTATISVTANEDSTGTVLATSQASSEPSEAAFDGSAFSAALSAGVNAGITLTGLTPGAAYTFWVELEDANGNRSVDFVNDITSSGVDLIPDQFQLAPDGASGVDPDSEQTFTFTIEGIDPGEDVVVTAVGGAQVSNGGAASASVTGQLNDEITVHIISGSFSQQVTGGASINGVTDSVPVTTRAAIVPVITTHPQNASVPNGNTVILTVAGQNIASGQWYKNGAPIAGQTGLSLTFVATDADDGATYYYVALSSDNQPVQSNTATLTISAVNVSITTDVLEDINTGTALANATINVEVLDMSDNELLPTTVTTNAQGVAVINSSSDVVGAAGTNVKLRFPAVTQEHTYFGVVA